MNADAIERAAQAIFAARRSHTLLDAIDDSCRPRNLQEAYAVQDRVFALYGSEPGGWFIGCSNPDIQRQLGLDQPYAARLLATSIFPSPAIVPVYRSIPTVLEVEFAFTIDCDLPLENQPYSKTQIHAAIRSVHPSIEVVIGSLRDWTHQDIFSVIADNGTDGALILGAGQGHWQDIDLNEVATSLIVNGQVERSGSGASVLSGPLSTLIWLANHPPREPGLLAGQVINTGSTTSMYTAQASDEVVADFGPLGRVELTLSSAD